VKCSAVVLFDIDGTLVRRSGPAHRDALSVAAQEVFGVAATTDGIPVHGMLDPDILCAMLTRAGLQAAAVRAAMPELQRAAEEYYLRVCPDLRHATCPGVRPLLERLRRRRVPLALVTGNFTRIGWHKLGRAGLAGYFRFGAFAEMAGTRAGLAAIAACELNARARVYLVGDAPSDIAAARENGFTSVAVHTGISSREELASCGPDYLLASLRFFKLGL
jgi:phosphoglycolate phosphatase